MKNIILLLAVAALTSLAGCSKQEEGPAEKAGKAIDETMQKAEAYTDEKMKEMGEAVEKAGKDMQKKE